MKKCPSCNYDLTKAPIKKFADLSLIENFKQKGILWKNLFYMDWRSIIMFVIIISMIVGYKADIAKYEDVIERPCEFCADNGCLEAYNIGFVYENGTLKKEGGIYGYNTQTDSGSFEPKVSS